MSKLGMPDVVVSFREKGIEAIQRSQRGIVLLVLEEEGKDLTQDYLSIYSVDDIPTDISEDNQEQIKLALLGYQTAPKKVMVYFIPPVSEEEESGGATYTGTGETMVEEAGSWDGEEESASESDTPATRSASESEASASSAALQDYTKVLKVLEGVKFTYLVIPGIIPEQVIPARFDPAELPARHDPGDVVDVTTI
mgnify:CR=1 FL=1